MMARRPLIQLSAGFCIGLSGGAAVIAAEAGRVWSALLAGLVAAVLVALVQLALD